MARESDPVHAGLGSKRFTGAPEIGRRRFLALASCGCACGAVPLALAGEDKPVDIGAISDFSRDGISDKFTSEGFFMVRRDGKLFAVTSTCSHMNEPLAVDSLDPSRIRCSGHDSVFDDEGRVLVGPASASLARLGISLGADGRLRVDRSRAFPEEKWDEAGAYLEIK